MTISTAQDRVGIGSDTHRFDTQRPLILGGVTIPESPGLSGHSDADALTHAIIDALLGAAALGDIGTHFPSSDAKWKNANSLDLLTQVVDLLSQHGYRIGNIDAIVTTESPPLQKYRVTMRQQLASAMGIISEDVSVKATRTEGLGTLGRGEGLNALAIVRILKSPVKS